METQKLSDLIRNEILRQVIYKSNNSAKQVTIVSRDIHDSLKLNARYPAVCSAMRVRKLESLGIEIVQTDEKYGVNFRGIYKLKR